jgi:hypothetical protein
MAHKVAIAALTASLSMFAAQKLMTLAQSSFVIGLFPFSMCLRASYNISLGLRLRISLSSSSLTKGSPPFESEVHLFHVQRDYVLFVFGGFSEDA